MSELTSPMLPPQTTIFYSGDLSDVSAPGEIEHFRYRGAHLDVRHGLLPAPEESTLILRGMGQSVGQAAHLLGENMATIRELSNRAFDRLGGAEVLPRALSRLFMPQYGPVLTVRSPIELPAAPHEDLVRALDFLSKFARYKHADAYPGLNPSKIKDDIRRYVAKFDLSNRDELVLWGNTARILNPDEMVIKPELAMHNGPPPLSAAAPNIPSGRFSIHRLSNGVLRFPEKAVLPPGATLTFSDGRLVAIQAWGGHVKVNRQSELYRDLTETEINHLGTMALGLSVEHSKFLTPNAEYSRRNVRQKLGLVSNQPIQHGLQRAFTGRLLSIMYPVNTAGLHVRPPILELLPLLASGQMHREVASQANLSERMLSYEVKKAREQFSVEEFTGVVTFGHLAGYLKSSAEDSGDPH